MPIRALRRLLRRAKTVATTSDADQKIDEIDRATGKLVAQVEENLRKRERIVREHNGTNGYHGRRRNGGAAEAT